MTSTANEDGKRRNNLKENLFPNGKVLNSRKIVRMKTIRNTERRSLLKEKRDLKLGQAVKIVRIIFPLLSCVIMVKMTMENRDICAVLRYVKILVVMEKFGSVVEDARMDTLEM